MSTISANTNTGATSPALRTDSLVDGVLILLAMTVVQRLVGLVRAVLFCRWLDAKQLGQWDMGFGFLMLVAPIAVLALPGAFGRYVERYRQQGQLRTFLRRTITVCSVLLVAAVVFILLARPWFATLVFGTSGQTALVAWLVVALVGLVGMNFLTELFISLRNVRVASCMHMANSVLFCALGVVFLVNWHCSATSVFAAYATGSLVTVAAALFWLHRTWHAAPIVETPITSKAMWSTMVPFAGWLLLSSSLMNAFAIVDRYMIVHYSRLPADAALSLVGQYHSSRVVPVLLVSVAALLAGMLTPHLSHDWEAGRRNRVIANLRLFTKLFGLGLMAMGVAVLIAAPLLFSVAFQGKFAGGHEVLPWTLAYCIWFSMVLILETYMFCAEKARLASVSVFVGLIANICLNLVLLPRLGLPGAVLATTVANLAVLVLICLFNHLLGFTADRGMVLILVLPLGLCLGTWPALMLFVAVGAYAIVSEEVFSCAERRILAEGYEQYLARMKGFLLKTKVY